jgi:peptide/nickel transport system substrate-binding protein
MSIKKIGWTLLSLLVISTMLIASCGPAATEVAPTEVPPTDVPEEPPSEEPTDVPEEPTEVPPTEVPAEPKTATVSFFEEPDTLNGLYTGMWFGSLAISFCQVDFWEFDDTGDINLEIASEFPTLDNGGISEDGLTVTFKLKETLWSDGTPLTAHDYIFTYDMMMSDSNAVQTQYPFDTFVESVTALDDYTIQIVMTDPYVGWAIGFDIGFLPRHILEPVYEAEGTIDSADWNRNPTVSNGPFKFVEWEAASHLVYEANENYWRGRPTLDQLFIRIVPDDEAQMAAIKAGDVDIGVYLTAADKPDIDAIEDVDLVSSSGGWMESWFFNLIDEELAATNDLEPGHVALQDKRVRQAIAMSFDRQSYIDNLFYGLYEVSPVLWYDSVYEDESIENWPFDPAAAGALLDEAGWVDTNDDGTRDKDGVELVIQFSTTAGNENRESTALIVQQQLGEVGIGVEILNYSYDVIWNSYGDDGPIALGLYDIAEWSMQPWDFPDPNTGDWLCEEIPSAEYTAGGNWQGVCIEELDELFALQAITVDLNERIEQYSRIEEIMRDEVFWLGVRVDYDFWGLNQRMLNVRFSGINAFWNMYEWDVSD